MRLWRAVVAAISMLPMVALAQNVGARFQEIATTTVSINGTTVLRPLGGGSVFVFTDPTGNTSANIYTDQALTIPMTNPLVVDKYGNFGFWIAPQSFYYRSCPSTTPCASPLYPGSITLGAGSPGTTTATGTNGSFNVPGTLTTPQIAGLKTINTAPFLPSDGLLNTLQIQQAAAATYAADTTQTFTDGTCYPWAASTYVNVYISDYSLHALRRPQSTTTTCLKNILNKFLAKVVTPGRENPTFGPKGQTLGGIPIALNRDGSVLADCSAWDAVCKYQTGDGWVFATLDEALYYDLTGDITQFQADAAKLEVALAAVPRDGTTGLVTITKYIAGTTPLGSEWIPWAFHEKGRDTGVDAMGSAWYYADAMAMSRLYTAAGNSAQAATWAGIAATIKTNMGTSSALWNASEGVYYAATGQNHQNDHMATAIAVEYGLTTPAQTSAFGSYLISHYAPVVFTATTTTGSNVLTGVSSTAGLYVGQELNGAGISGGYVITAIGSGTLTMSINATATATITARGSNFFKYGFMRQAKTNWQTVGYIAANGSYSSGDAESAPGCYQDGYWSVTNLGALNAINSVSTSAVALAQTDYMNGPDPTMEFWSDSLGCARQNGGTYNMGSPAGNAAFALLNPSLGTPARTQLHSYIGGGEFLTDAGVAGPSLQVSSTIGNHAAILQNRYDATNDALHYFTTGYRRGDTVLTGWSLGLSRNSPSFLLSDISLGAPIMSAAPGSGLVKFGSAGSSMATVFGNGVVNQGFFGANCYVKNAIELSQNTALPCMRIGIDATTQQMVLQYAPATTGIPVWVTKATLTSTGDLISTNGYAITAPTTTVTPTCTPNGYITTTINGVTVRLATCP